MKATLSGFVISKKEHFVKLLQTIMKTKSDSTIDLLDSYLAAFGSKPISVAEFAKFIENKKEFEAKLKFFDEVRQDIESMIKTLKRTDPRLISTSDVL